MAAIFTDLHEVGQVLSEHIREELGIDDVQPGPPRDVSAAPDPGARVTLLYVTPQPQHRSDPPERLPDGSLRAPPLSLLCFYLLTTSGADADDPIAAHHTLGRIMTLYHDVPELELPLPAGNPLGEGTLSVVQVPMTLDQIDKIWTSLDAQLQPWALFQVAPVELLSQREDEGPPPVVRPGGVGLDATAAQRPEATRVTPEVARAGGQIRVDAILDGEIDGIRTGGILVSSGDARLTVADEGAPARLALTGTLQAPLTPGAHALTIRSGGVVSRQVTLRIADPAVPIVDAPPLTHSAANDLVLTGAVLDDAQEAVLWPDEGITGPADVHVLAVSDVSATELTIVANELTVLPVNRGPWRLTVKIGDHVYTPYVVVDLEPAP